GFPEGGWAELKTLVHSRESPDYFVPLIWFSIFNQKRHRYLFHFPLDPPAAIQANLIGVNNYALETDYPMVRIYEKLGFKVIKEVKSKEAPDNRKKSIYILSA